MSAPFKTGLLLLLMLTLAGCGRKGKLIYPDQLLPAPPSNLKLLQSGSAVRISMQIPERNIAGQTMRNISVIKISRLVSAAPQRDVCTACQSEYKPHLDLQLNRLPEYAELLGNTLIVIDGGVKPGHTVSYRVAATADGQEGGASVETLQLVNKILPPRLLLESLPGEIRLRLAGDPAYGGGLKGFNIYRSASGESRAYRPLNRELVTGVSYIDSNLERGVKYHYAAAAILDNGIGGLVESEISEWQSGVLKNDE